MFVPGKPFQPSLIFAGKAGAYPSEAPCRCSTLGWGELTLQHYLSPNLACNSMSILKVVGEKFMYLVKSMVLMYITHFKLFG